MKIRNQLIILLCVGVLVLLWTMLLFDVYADREYLAVNRLPRIDPDYSGITVPHNIAPLNFVIKEEGRRYQVRIVSTDGKPIEISTKKSKIKIPFKAWKTLLSQNRGQEYQIEISIENSNGQWQRFESITNRIASESIDGFLAYRLIHPAYNLWQKLGIYQRNLQNFNEKPILLNSTTDGNCMNCHSFCNNNPDQMILHLRGGPASGTLLNQKGDIVKVNTSTDFNRAGAYPAWHPNGKLIAFSVNKLSMFFHATGECRDVLDHASDLIIYEIDSNIVTTSPEVSSPDRLETFPNWSPDGNYLYFCSAPQLEHFISAESQVEDLLYDKILYDLKRIRYYPENKTWGELETVLSSYETGLSITQPRVSPDGRYLLFCMAKYGNFPIYMESSDLYVLDLNTGQYYKPDVNSDRAETFHSWSSNSRWFVFSSKRRDGLCARPYFSYVDENGTIHKPFLLPQKDPEFYAGFLTTYNVPELIKGPVKASPQVLARIAYDPKKALKAQLDPNVKVRQSPETPEVEWHPAPQ